LIDGYEPTPDVLVETFCEGVPVMEFARNNAADKKLLSRMCRGGIKAICQMIFLDNFVHGMY
jgi:aarF domain-containing kinase